MTPPPFTAGCVMEGCREASLIPHVFSAGAFLLLEGPDLTQAGPDLEDPLEMVGDALLQDRTGDWGSSVARPGQWARASAFLHTWSL